MIAARKSCKATQCCPIPLANRSWISPYCQLPQARQPPPRKHNGSQTLLRDRRLVARNRTFPDLVHRPKKWWTDVLPLLNRWNMPLHRSINEKSFCNSNRNSWRHRTRVPLATQQNGTICMTVKIESSPILCKTAHPNLQECHMDIKRTLPERRQLKRAVNPPSRQWEVSRRMPKRCHPQRPNCHPPLHCNAKSHRQGQNPSTRCEPK